MENKTQPKTKKVRASRTAKQEITEENYMDFSAKALFEEIEKLRNQPGLQEIKKENRTLKARITRAMKYLGSNAK